MARLNPAATGIDARKAYLARPRNSVGKFPHVQMVGVPFMLITCQIIPYVAQKTKNTWPGMINHIIINGAIMAAL